jgi:tripartite-type tricarboxylate transporter receptor subunit TctC
VAEHDAQVGVDKLNNEILRILSAPDTKERFASLGMEAIGGTPQDFAKYLQVESEKWAKIVEAAHLQMPQ